MIYQYITIFLLSSLITFLLVPKIIKIGHHFNYIDSPDKRKKHKKNIVRIGGLAIYLGLMFSLIIARIFGWVTEDKMQIILITQVSSSLFFLIGFFDDIFSISSIKRLILQSLVAILIWMQGIQINNLDFLDITTSDNLFNLPMFLSLFITVFWIVGVTNSFNWLDGLDGLCCGIALISSLSFISLFLSYTNNSELFLIFALAGACLAFLFFNFYPAKVFMGDGGSYLLGSNLALFSIYSHKFFIETNFNHWSFLSPLLILFIPLVDMSYVVFSRIYEGKLPFFPDRRHLHYRLMDTGISHRRTVLLFYFFSIIFSSLALACLP
tara:strand:- start:22613 stop:23584 length:972 start_codon:yes stop_codon:yes gene_type:complete